MPTLSISTEGEPAREVSWQHGCIGIGRDPTNQVVIADETVARWHAAIYDDGEGQFRLRDLTGKRALRVGGMRVDNRPLVDGDVIEVAGARLNFAAAVTGEPAARPILLRQGRAEGDTPGETGERAPWFSHLLREADAPGRPSVRRLLEACDAIGRHLDPDDVLRALLGEVRRLKAPSKSFVARVESDGKTIELSSDSADGQAGARQAVVMQEIESECPILLQGQCTLADLSQCERPELISPVASPEGIHTAMCVPIPAAHRRVAAVLYADWRTGTAVPTTAEMEWIAALCQSAATAFQHSLERRHWSEEFRRLQLRGGSGDSIVGISPASHRLIALADRCAAADVDVIINGETGTGKELVARRIHQRSGRSDRPFVAVNCAAIPAELLESELFGHARGAFTGAVDDHRGRFVEADGGTLFLDEVAELSPIHQAKLLRVMEERRVTPVGGATRSVDVRVIAATNILVEQAVSEGKMRADFRRRLGVPIETSPLRDHPEDIPVLAFHLLDLLSVALEKPVVAITRAAMTCLVAYEWPGNVRELRNCLRNAMLLSGERIEVADLRLTPEVTAARADALPSLEEVKGEHLARVLRAARGHQGEAAKILGVSEDTVKSMMDRHGLSRRAFRE